MTTSQRSKPASSDALESLAEQLSSILCEPSLELALATQRQHLDTGASNDKEKKAVNFRLSKTTQSLVSMVYAKQFAMSKSSILSTATPNTPGSIYRRKTLLDQPVPNEMKLKAWKHTDEFTKLAAAAAPLYEMAKARSWELKTFTLILNRNLSDRLDSGDSTALEYIRDQMTRLIRRTVDPRAEFLYGIEKAPEALADKSSRRRWHLHGAMIGPAGFSATGKTALRTKIQSIKGEADADLRFDTPGASIERDQRASVLGWCFYSVKNGLSVEIKPSLVHKYELPPGKHTFISSHLRREAKRWHEARLGGELVSELLAGAPELYTAIACPPR
ncbi:hypothetical protein [Pseudomonas sp.]|uniref:hypothetical protein n=1 Tax=Pseudomonas sp. TaxID=306 RepID=UPI0028AD1A6E|nr:hypothetical protein [Pseudomonas sp.]